VGVGAGVGVNMGVSMGVRVGWFMCVQVHMLS